VSIITTAFLLGCAPVADLMKSGEPQLVRESYFSEITGLERDYYVYLPKDFSEQRQWPVMLFLHGNGERGDGRGELDFVMVHGPLYEAWVQKRDLPFVIVAPQLPMYGMGEVQYIKNRSAADIPRRLPEGVPAREAIMQSEEPMGGSPTRPPDEFGIEGPPSGWALHEAELIGMIDTAIRKYRGDPDRVYITGLSYGGFGAWYMAGKYPERFAAASPIAAYAHPDLADSIAAHQLPIWCFAGGRDPVVPVAYFYDAVNKLERLGHENLRFTVEEDMNHDVWKRVYAGQDVYDWLLSHSK
jgi:predicted peptidase